jgi:DnaK suppressor protein
VTAAQRAKFKKRLSALEEELTGRGPKRITPNRASEAEVGGDEDEQALNEMLQSIASNRNRNLQGMLVRVQHALTKLSDEPAEFGLCEDCGEDIETKRLVAMPYAELCVTCQSQKDEPPGSPTRRKLTDYR